MRVEVLAKNLGVTKGGFYRRFRDRAALLEAMLASWSMGRIAAIEAQTSLDGITARERLRALNLRVEPVSIRGLDEVAAGLRKVGALLGTQGSAEMAAERYAARLARLRARHRDAQPRLRVYYQIELQPAYSINRDSPISQAIELCGGENVFADLPTQAATVNQTVMDATATSLSSQGGSCE